MAISTRWSPSPVTRPAAGTRLGSRGDGLWGEVIAAVCDGEHSAAASNACRDPDAASVGQVVDDRVVHEVRSELEQECVGTDRVCRVAGRLDDDAAFLREGKERLNGFFRHEGQVDALAAE